MRSQKIRLKLTKEQESLCWWYSKVSRNYWNLLVDLDRRNNLGKFNEFLSERNCKTYYSKFYDREIYKLNDTDYRKLVKYFIDTNNQDNEYDWYYHKDQSFIYSSLVREFRKIKYQNKGKVSFRSIKDTIPSFNITCCISSNKKRPSKIYLKENNKLQIPTLGDVGYGKLRKDFDINGKKQVAKVSFDGKYWYLSYTEDVTIQNNHEEYTEGVGLDLGIKTLITVSNGLKVPNIKTLRRYKVLTRRLKIKQRQRSKKALINKNKITKSIIKKDQEIRLIYRKIKNIRLNHIREFTSKLVKKIRHRYIVMEDLNVKGMMKNKYLARDIQNCSFYTIRENITRKAKEWGIEVRIVNRFYPSSKICNCCGFVKQDLKLKDRVYKCTNCGTEIDRDLNASINLKQAKEYVIV